jgi:acetyl esterase/lipase
VTSVVTLSAAGDLTADAAELGDPAPDLEKVVLAYLGCDSADDCAVAAAASPLTVAAALPPTLLVHGSEEIIPIEQAEALDAALAEAGVEHELIVVDGERHGLQLLNNQTRAAIVEFLDTSTSS